MIRGLRIFSLNVGWQGDPSAADHLLGQIEVANGSGVPLLVAGPYLGEDLQKYAGFWAGVYRDRFLSGEERNP